MTSFNSPETSIITETRTVLLLRSKITIPITDKETEPDRC